MKIRFTEYPENLPEKIFHLDLIKEEDAVFIEIVTTDMCNNEINSISRRFKKCELKDLIGALLHIQSKIK